MSSAMSQVNDDTTGNAPLVDLRLFEDGSSGESKECAAGALQNLVVKSKVASVQGYGLLSVMHAFLC